MRVDDRQQMLAEQAGLRVDDRHRARHREALRRCGAGRRVNGRQLRAHREIGGRRARRNRLRVHVLERDRRPRERHRAERRGLDVRAPVQLHPARGDVGDQRLERTRHVRARVDRFVGELAHVGRVARQRERLHAVELRARGQRAVRRVDAVEREFMVTAVAAAVQREMVELRRRAAFVDRQVIDAQVVDPHLQRQAQVLRGRGRFRRPRHDPHVDRARAQVRDRQPPRRAGQRPAAFEPVDPHFGAGAAGARPREAAQPHAGRERAAFQRARQPSAQHAHGRLPGEPRAALGRRGGQHEPDRQHDEQHDRRERPRSDPDRPPAARCARRRVGRALGRIRIVRRRRVVRVLRHAVRRGSGNKVRKRCRASGTGARCGCAARTRRRR